MIRWMRVTASLHPSFRVLRNAVRLYSTKAECKFGVLIDVDGVITRGRDILPFVREAFSLLADCKGNFRVPTVFLTNASNTMRAAKAERLSELLQIPISPSQVVLAHSPLKTFTEWHDKHVLVVGQGPVKEIANKLGFTTVTRLEDLYVPHLDCVDLKRRELKPLAAFGDGLKRIEGSFDYKRGVIKYPHIAIIACNVDLLWMETDLLIPRFGHGIFLMCLETIYRTLSGHDLQYMAVLGKPSEISYVHATRCIQEIAKTMGLPSPRRLYVIGDNPDSDILGANLYGRYLQQENKKRSLTSDEQQTSSATIEQCLSILVETGVYSYDCAMNSTVQPMLSEVGDSKQVKLRIPSFVEKNLLAAIRTIFGRERYSPY